MEKFNRDDFAKELNDVRRVDKELAADLLEKVKQTDEYKDAKHAHRQKTVKNEIKGIREKVVNKKLEAIMEKTANSKQKQQGVEQTESKISSNIEVDEEQKKIIKQIEYLIENNDSPNDYNVSAREFGKSTDRWALANKLKKEYNDPSGYIIIADWRLTEGDFYRVSEALENADISEDDETFKDYKRRCAIRALELVRDGRVFGKPTRHAGDLRRELDQGFKYAPNVMEVDEIIATLSENGVDITAEDYKLLADLQKMKINSVYDGFAKENPDKYKELISKLEELKKLSELSQKKEMERSKQN